MSRRAVIYSHDTFGIGNIRRTFELCRALSRRIPDLSILVITGSPLANAFSIPVNVDYVKLPALKRAGRGEYRARAHGFISEDIQGMRAEICLAAVERFDPDIVLVDKAPFGVAGELAPALRRLRVTRPDCPRILALRDILDTGEAVRESWRRGSVAESIAEQYDAVWVFGSPAFFDVASEYELTPSLARKVTYLGWIGRSEPPIPAAEKRRQLGLDCGPVVLVTAGGGDDGELLFGHYVRALNALEDAEQGLQSVLISGPLASPRLREQVANACRGGPRRRFLEFDPDLLSAINAADAVVSMCGYNTTCEILLLRKPALVVPRHQPVQEQMVRASRLSALGALHMCQPEELSTSRLVAEIQKLLHDFTPAHLDRERFPFTALERASEYVERLLSGIPATAGAGLAHGLGFAAQANPHAHPIPRTQ